MCINVLIRSFQIRPNLYLKEDLINFRSWEQLSKRNKDQLHYSLFHHIKLENAFTWFWLILLTLSFGSGWTDRTDFLNSHSATQFPNRIEPDLLKLNRTEAAQLNPSSNIHLFSFWQTSWVWNWTLFSLLLLLSLFLFRQKQLI